MSNAALKSTAEKIVAEADNPSWPEPDLSLVYGTEILPPAFDEKSLPPEWMVWCKAMAQAKACPIDFIVINLLVCASAWLGNARRVAASCDWIEQPHLWGAVVSPPSGGKTPSQQPFVEACKILEHEAEPAWENECAEYEINLTHAKAKLDAWEGAVKEAAKSGKSPPDRPDDVVLPNPPAKPRVLISDATTQEIAPILRDNPKGLLQLRDELSAWIGSFDQYSGKGADRGFFLESWNGGRHSVDRKQHTGKPIVVPYVSLAILGGLQPDKLREAFSGADDGFAARFCPVWPALVPYAPLSQEGDAESATRANFLYKTARKIHNLSMDVNDRGDKLPKNVKLSSEARILFEEIRKEAHQKARNTKGLSTGWHGKTPARALRLALIIEYLRWAVSTNAPEPLQVSADAMAYAGTYIDYLALMFERVIGGLSYDEAEEDAANIMRFILANQDDYFNRNKGKLNERALYQTAGFSYLRGTNRRKAALNVLQRDGWIRSTSHMGKGRKASDWELNPELKEAVS